MKKTPMSVIRELSTEYMIDSHNLQSSFKRSSVRNIVHVRR